MINEVVGFDESSLTEPASASDCWMRAAMAKSLFGPPHDAIDDDSQSPVWPSALSHIGTLNVDDSATVSEELDVDWSEVVGLQPAVERQHGDDPNDHTFLGYEIQDDSPEVFALRVPRAEENSDNSQQADTSTSALTCAVRRSFAHPADSSSARRGRFIDMLHASALCATDGKYTLLVELGQAYMTSFEHFNGDSDLDAAVAAFHEASLMRLPDEWRVLSELSRALRVRFLRFHVDTDLEQSIKLAERARDLADGAQADQTSRAVLHFDVASAYETSFLRTGDLKQLETAIEEGYRALELDRDMLPDLINIIPQAPSRILPLNDLSHIDEAIDILNRKLQLQNQSAHLKAALYVSLAFCLRRRYMRSLEPADNIRVVDAFRHAIANETNDWYRLMQLNHLVHALWMWHKSSPDAVIPPHALRHMLDVNLKALRCHGSAEAMLDAAVKRSALCEEWRFTARCYGAVLEDSSMEHVAAEEINALQRVLDLIPSLALEGLTISRRYEEIAKLSPVVHSAVSIAAARNNPVMVKWFEQGRTLVWGQIQDLRTYLDIEELLAEDCPVQQRRIAIKYNEVTAAYQEALSSGRDAVITRRLRDEHERLLSRIRKLSGFKDFLQAEEVDDLVVACRTGPLVCINMHSAPYDEQELLSDRGCHALIIGNSAAASISAISLPLLSPSKAQEWRMRLNGSLGLQPVRKSYPAKAVQPGDSAVCVLQELWNCVVKPIFDALHMTSGSRSRTLPHITWCMTGALAFLPLHAAGPYDNSSPNAFDLAVSSYTPNIASLLRTPPTNIKSPPNVLVISQAAVENYPALPGTHIEAAKIRALFPDSSTLLEGPAGTVAEVLGSMATHAYIHLACHGIQDAEDPLKSAFILADGPLTLERLMSSKSSVAELAFLSACETATGDEKVPDEAVHLAAGMLSVGYRTVVATMWSIGDNNAPLVADAFYRELLAQRDADGKTDPARALHYAVAKLRTHVGEDQFAQWVPFVHWGV